MVIIDTNREHLAISEAVKLGVPIVAVVDSNSDPDNINYPIPGNDDAIRSIRLYCTLFADAALAGIQDALADSGVDVGSANKVAKENKTLDGVTKLEKVAKVSKARPKVEVSEKKPVTGVVKEERIEEVKTEKVEAKKAPAIK